MKSSDDYGFYVFSAIAALTGLCDCREIETLALGVWVDRIAWLRSILLIDPVHCGYIAERTELVGKQ